MAVAPPGTSQVAKNIITARIVMTILYYDQSFPSSSPIDIQVFPMMCGTCSNENGIKLMFMRSAAILFQITSDLCQAHVHKGLFINDVITSGGREG